LHPCTIGGDESLAARCSAIELSLGCAKSATKGRSQEGTMRASSVVWLKVCFVLVSVSRLAFGQASAGAAQAPGATGSAPTTGVRAEATRLMEDAETKLTQLAQAIPAEKYSWRPSKDARSVSEVFLHVAGGNFGIPRRLGTDPPAGFNFQGFDKSITDKTKVIDTLKQSFVHAKQAVAKLTDAEMEKTAEWTGGRQATYREIIFFLAAHQHEHLGQAIAYARMNGITPPWTEEQQRQKAQPKPKTEKQQPKSKT
jgi:uncharacterized damage-inducible protein DinB